METKWKQIFDMEVKNINKDEYNVYLPIEKELCLKYDVARNTIRKVVLELKNQGFIYKDNSSNRFKIIKNSGTNKLFSIKELNPNINSKIKYIHISNYDNMGVCLKYFKEKYLNNSLHSFEECYVRRDILPKDILANKDQIEESIFTFIEKYQLETISYSKRRIQGKKVGDSYYVFNILDVYNQFNEPIMHFNTISKVEDLDVSYLEYR